MFWNKGYKLMCFENPKAKLSDINFHLFYNFFKKCAIVYSSINLIVKTVNRFIFNHPFVQYHLKNIILNLLISGNCYIYENKILSVLDFSVYNTEYRQKKSNQILNNEQLFAIKLQHNAFFVHQQPDFYDLSPLEPATNIIEAYIGRHLEKYL